MRLIEAATLELIDFVEGCNPPYACLSHRWSNEEVSFQQWQNKTPDLKSRAGYLKVIQACEIAQSQGISFLWADTCCIDKSSSAELSKAINSMFHWYQSADKCYVYLSDVSTSGDPVYHQSSDPAWKAAFRESRWFRRGWTLQELIAPALVEFFSREGDRLGSKKTLEQDIHEITRIAIEALRGGSLLYFTVEERLSWAKHRETKHPEDEAYALSGIFDVFMPLLYAEGREKAFARLREEIDKSTKRSPSIRLEIAEEAAFDAIGRDHDPLYLPGTRTDLLQDIRGW